MAKEQTTTTQKARPSSRYGFFSNLFYGIAVAGLLAMVAVIFIPSAPLIAACLLGCVVLCAGIALGVIDRLPKKEKQNLEAATPETQSEDLNKKLTEPAMEIEMTDLSSKNKETATAAIAALPLTPSPSYDASSSASTSLSDDLDENDIPDLELKEEFKSKPTGPQRRVQPAITESILAEVQPEEAAKDTGVNRS
jgi:hypothetical protein